MEQRTTDTASGGSAIQLLTVVCLNSSTKIDCTLSSESTGQECLENVCQRISIQQPDFFGLRYMVKGTKDELRWVDLTRPLSRQLEKYSSNTKVLYLRVMYYVLSGVSLIQDEGTRNYYFLQLKHDVVEGRISCDPKQAVILANYSRQAEYGNHQDRHTVEYLKTLLSFPHELIQADLLETLTEEVIRQAHELHNVTQGDAESLYISACQQLDGYGQETFTAKNDHGQEVMLGISVSGIIVASDTNKFYPWRDITNVVNHKRAFNIECAVPSESVGFTVVDVATGRYIWKLCALQHRFFVKFEQNQTQASQMNLNLFQNLGDNLNDSRDDLLSEQQYQQACPSPGSQQYLGSTTWQSTSEHASHSNLWNNTPAATAASMVETQPSPLMSSNTNIASGSINNLNSNTSIMHSRSSLQTSTLDINLNSTAVPLEYSNHGSNWGLNPAGSNASLINRAQSSSCLDLSNNNISQERDRLKALLPTYRPAPDYETAIQQKYRSSSNDVRLVNGNLLHLSASQMLAPEQSRVEFSVSGSQPDVSSYYGQLIQQQLQVQQQPYPDVTNHTNPPMITPHYSDASDYGLTHRFKMMRVQNAPPPYPANRLSSTSTPDLASHRALLGYRGAHVSGSSPDLVSTRPLANHHQLLQLSQSNQVFYPGLMSNPHQLRHSQTILPHGTYENLNCIEPSKPSLLSTNQPGNVYYYVPGGVEHLLINPDGQYHSSSTPPSTHLGIGPKPHLNRSSQHINGSIEPIYENVPLPWTNDGDSLGEIRNRTASVQSAPGVQQHPLRSGALLAQQQANCKPIDTVPPQKTINRPENGPQPKPAPSHFAVPPSLDAQNNNNNTTCSTSMATESHKLSTMHLTYAADNNTMSNPNSNSSVGALRIESINRSHSANNVLDSSQSQYTSYALGSSDPPHHGTTIHNAHNDSGISSIAGSINHGAGGSSNTSINQNVTTSSTTTMSSSTASSGKESNGRFGRKIWDILGGRSKHSAEKQKSATLGREKDRKNKASAALGGSGGTGSGSANSSMNESNGGAHLKHRWSTGQPRLQPLPANVSKEKLCSMLESKLADPQLYCEFERIPKRSENAKYDCALADENKNKNFDPNFLPYDSNRVHLTPTRDNRMGYVNASRITSTVGNKQRFYIVAESPNDVLTSNIFWQCVWEADVYLLVQLSKELSYIPQTSERCLEYGQYQVWREFTHEADRCTTSKLRVYHTQSRRYRSVWHLSYTEWVDQNCPCDVGHFLGFLEELNSVRLASIAEVPPSHNTNPPVLIHCNEGGGRTGVTLVADLLLYTLDHNQDIDIPRLIGQIRQQRDNIIPSLAQYKFIHALLTHYLKQNRLI